MFELINQYFQFYEVVVNRFSTYEVTDEIAAQITVRLIDTRLLETQNQEIDEI